MELFPIQGNSQQLDGSAMFRNAPKMLCSRWIKPDAEKRVFLEDKPARDVRLFFTHDDDGALAKVTRDERGRFGATGEQHELCGASAPSLAGAIR